MNRATILAFIILLLLSLNVSAAFKEMEKLEDQPETSQPTPYSINDIVKWLRNNTPYEAKVIGVTDKSTYWLASDGCKEKFPNAGFSAPIEWAGCGKFGTGEATVKYKGQPWPLKNGKKWKINIQGSGWQLNRSCKVKKAVKVLIDLGEFDTYKIECSDASNNLSWYIDINTGQTIYFTHSNSYFNTNTKLEAVEIR